MRMDIIVKGVQRMDGEKHEIVQQNNSAKVKPVMNQSGKEVGKFRDRNEISPAFQKRITELAKEVKDLKNKQRTRFSTGEFLLLVDIREVGDFETSVTETEELNNVMVKYMNKNQKWVPLRAMKTFITKKMGHTT